MAKEKKALPIQLMLIQKLKEIIPPHVGLAEEIAEILKISSDSAYRRLRGETEISIDEVYKLSAHFSFSVDSLFSNLGDTATFTYTKLTDSAENFEKYLTRIYNHLRSINSFPDRKLYYVAEEIPIFYSFFGRKLAEFKLFYWQRSVLNVPIYQGKKFEFGVVPDSIIQLAENCLEEYKKMPSLEIWTEDTIFTAIRQLEFYFHSGVFANKEDALLVLEELEQMVNYLETSAADGRKLKSDTEETFQFYWSEVVLGTNCIYVVNGENQYAYISFNTLNSLTTANLAFCEETDHWVKNLVKKSNLISGVGEKQRYQFFSKVYAHIEACKLVLMA